MKFTLVKENENKLKVFLSCGYFFFGKKKKKITGIHILIFILFFIFLSIYLKIDLLNLFLDVFNEKLTIVILHFVLGILYFVCAITISNKENGVVIMEVTSEGITITPEIQSSKEFIKPIHIEQLNIDDIYVKLEELTKPLADKRFALFSIILKTKKPIQLQFDRQEKSEFLLYRGHLNRDYYKNVIEIELNKIKQLLKLSVDKNIKVVTKYYEQYDPYSEY